jgi:excisionase family DNA binding protein
LDIAQLAEWLNISERHVRRLVHERRVPFHKVGGRVRFVGAEVCAWLDDNWIGPARPAADLRPRAHRAPRVI